MCRFRLFALLLVSAAVVAAVVVVRLWATDSPPAAKTVDENPFGGNADEPPPPGLRPYPPRPRSVSPQPAMTGGVSAAAPAQGASLVRIFTPEMAATPEPLAFDNGDAPAEAKIKTALQSPTEITCEQTSLRDVVEQLKKRHNIEIELDLPALKQAGVAADCPVTKHLSGIRLKSALNLLLDDLQLKYVIYNKILLITSLPRCEIEDGLLTKLYPVKDLILVRNEKDEIETDFQQLIDLIENSVARRTWFDNGGTGSITTFQFQDRCLLVVSQTEEVHERIACLLAALRRSAAHDGKSGSPLRLPRRPRPAAPAFLPPPGVSPQSSLGSGMF